MLDQNELKSLGAGRATEYQYDSPNPGLLECFPNPFKEATARSKGAVDGSIEIKAPEFTSLCPVTGQPDYATIVITYDPADLCVESKSLKLYLMSFRNHGCFHEAVVNMIGEDLRKLLDPVTLMVHGKFTPRGGISFWPLYSYYKGGDDETAGRPAVTVTN